MSFRPRRSVLYMPGSNQRALEKARSLSADALVFDLEDAVAPEQKLLARSQVVGAVQQGGYGAREMVIRANSLASEWGVQDVQSIALSGADALCLPKVEQADEIVAALQIMDAAGAPPTMSVWVMIETPAGVLNIDQITAADPRMTVIVMGTTDLAKELRVPHSTDRLGLQYALSRCVLAARAGNKDILDGVYLDLEDDSGFANACQQGRNLGFDGKTLIHPRQLAAANQVFGVDVAELQRAKNIIDAWQQAQAHGKGVAVVDGKLVEVMHVDEAKRNLQIAKVIAELGD